MDVTEGIERRLEIREYADDPVDEDTKRAILDAGRLAPSGKNVQHWRFILVEEDSTLRELAERSSTGVWIEGTDFAVVLTTNPEHAFHEIDAGRAVTYMQFAAWAEGVGSCIYTGFDEGAMRRLLDVPADEDVTLVAGFGNPDRDTQGRKNRKPLDDVAFRGRYGDSLDLAD